MGERLASRHRYLLPTGPVLRRPVEAATCNQPFSAWNEIFPDPTMTVAAIDRLVHHTTVLELNTESYRRRAALGKIAKIEAG